MDPIDPMNEQFAPSPQPPCPPEARLASSGRQAWAPWRDPDFMEAAFARHEWEVRAVRRPITACFDARDAAVKVLGLGPRLRRLLPELEPPIPEQDMPRIERVFSLAEAVLHLDYACREASGGASRKLGRDYAEGVKLRRRFRDAARMLRHCGVAAPTLQGETRGAVGHFRLAIDLERFVAFLRNGGVEHLARQAALSVEELQRAITIAHTLFAAIGCDQMRRLDLRQRRRLRRNALTLLCAAYEELRTVVLLRRHAHGDGEHYTPVIFPKSTLRRKRAVR
jgi:hypothetical protein